MSLVVIIALGVLLALVIFKNGRTVLVLFVVGVIAVLWMQVNREDRAREAAEKSQIERSVK